MMTKRSLVAMDIGKQVIKEWPNNCGETSMKNNMAQITS